LLWDPTNDIETPPDQVSDSTTGGQPTGTGSQPSGTSSNVDTDNVGKMVGFLLLSIIALLL
jgi:hypothetical protein